MPRPRVHLTADLEAALKTRILRLQLNPQRDLKQEGELEAYQQVLSLAHGGLTDRDSELN